MEPAFERVSIFSRWIKLNGLSRGTQIKGKFSFNVTSAALEIKSWDMPDAILPIQPIDAGMIIIPLWRKEPEAIL